VAEAKSPVCSLHLVKRTNRTLRFSHLPLLAVALLASGCGAFSSSDQHGPTKLKIAYWEAGEGVGAPVEVLLSCEPVRGQVPDPAAACAALEDPDVVAALEPVPADAMCTEIYGGPEEARITGSIDDRDVDVLLTRVDGCEIDRWERLRVLLPGVG
jgi:hypothetical protein